MENWSFKVCRESTETTQVEVWIGRIQRNEPTELNDMRGEIVEVFSTTIISQLWATYNRNNSVVEFQCPSSYNNLGSIYVYAKAAPSGLNVHMGVFYNNKCKQVMSFDKNEDHIVSITNSDKEFHCPK